MKEQQRNAVVLTATGMVCSLGLDVDTAAAAARAGIARAEELEYPLKAPEPSGVSAAVGNSVPLIVDGFEGPARLRRLLEGALRDLKNHVPADAWPEGMPFYISLPDGARVRTGGKLLVDQADCELSDDEEEYPEPDRPHWKSIIEAALRATNWSVPAPVCEIFTSGHTGTAEAIERALADMVAGKCAAALIGGVDSLIGERTLSWLERTGRLKTPANPTGIVPGEAAAVFLLEQRSSAESNSRTRRPVLQSVSITDEPRHLFSGEQSIGTGMHQAIERLKLPTTAATVLDPTRWFITDLNGEDFSASEWGNTLIRLARSSGASRNFLSWSPAASFGDVGAAMGAVSVCVAAKAWERGYAPSARVIATSASDGVKRAAFALELGHSPVHGEA